MITKSLFLLTAALFLASLFSACTNTRSNNQVNNQSSEEAGPLTLSLPTIPVDSTTSEGKSAYLLKHFWDSLNFSDTLKSHNRDFMEQNFSNFVSLIPYVPIPIQKDAVDSLILKSQSDTTAYRLIADIAHKYLYDPNSPFLSEEIYAYFVDNYKNSKIFGISEISRYEFIDEILQKNQVGSKASDFSFVTKEGRKMNLYDFAKGMPVLLIFYDPDCDNCEAVIGSLKKSEKLKNIMIRQNLKVLAIYSGENKLLWQQKLDLMPPDWTVGYDPGDIEEKDLYYLRAMPTLYLLDPDKIVYKKDVNPEFFM